MNNWQRWVQAPQTHWLRRLLFQIHLWMGIGLGLYILIISVSGSAVVLRPQFSRWFVPSEVAEITETELTGEILNARLEEVYTEYEVQYSVPSSRPGRALYVGLKKDEVESNRFFDQYAGVDLGNTFPWQVQSIEWLTDLHDDLLMGRQGRKINGIGGILFLIMVISGTIIWWQGRSRWKESLIISSKSKHSFNWQLHSFLGFWSLILMFAWGITAVYFAFPEPFNILIDWLDDDINDFERPDGFLLFLIDIHFGRFRGMLWANILWVFLGLLPAVMFITGFILWYKRVVKRWLAPKETSEQ